MESKLNKEILDFHHNLVKTKDQAKKLKKKLEKYSREWAQVASFETKCKETQTVLVKFVRIRRG